MILKKLILSVLAVCFAVAGTAEARNVFVLPAGTTANLPISVFAADPFAATANVAGPASPIVVLAVPNGSKYYVIARGAADTLTVLDANFNVIGSPRSLQSAQAAAVSPDGRYLLIASGNLLIFDTANDQQVRSIDAGVLPSDIAFSIDGTRAFVVSSGSQRITAIDMSTLTALATTIPISGGSTPTTLAVSPNGFLYAAGQNIIRQIDTRSATIVGDIPIIGNPGEMVFSANGQLAVVPNLFPANGNSSTILIDLATRRPTTVTANVGYTFDRLVYGGRNAAGLERVFAFSRENARVNEIVLPSMQLSTPTFAGAIGQIAGIAASSEFPSPQYLFVSNGAALHRVTLATGEVSGGPLTLASAGGDIFYAGPVTTTGASTITIFNNNQNVQVETGVLTPIVVRVTDAAGRPVADIPITFASAAGNVIFTSSSARTTSEGYAVVIPATPASTGTFTFTATAGGATSEVTFSVTGTGGGGGGGGGPVVPGATLRIISGNGQALQPPRSFALPEPIIYELRDANGNPIREAEVIISVTSGATAGQLNVAGLTCTTATLCTVRTDNAGRITVGFTATALIGSNPVQTVIVNAAHGGVSVDAYINVIQDNVFIQRDFLKPGPGATIELRAGQTLNDAIRFQFHSFGGLVGAPQPLAGVGLNVSTEFTGTPALGPTASCRGGIALSAAGPATGACLAEPSGVGCPGVASCDLVAGSVPGETNLLISAAGNQFFGVRLRVLPAAATAARINITGGNNQSATPGQTLATALSVQVVDANGQPVANQQINWELTSAGGAVLAAPTTTTTDAQGRASTRLTVGNTTGTFQVRAGIPGTTTVAAFSFTVTPTLGGLTVVSGNNQGAQRGSAFGQPLVVRVTNAAGAAASGIPVSFVVTSGSATLSAASATTDASGQASVNITAGNTQGPVVVTASAGGINTTFNLTVSPPGPQFTAANLVNAASFIPVQQIASGMLLTITGTGIATGVQGTVSPASIVGPFPTTLAGVEVLIGGLQAPILHVSNSGGREQVTVQVPFELPTTGSTSVTVRVQGAATTVQNVPLAPVQPGIFETEIGGQRWAVLIRQDGSFVTPSSPARRGEVVRMFLHGLGQVTPATATNQAGTGDQRVTAQLTVGVNNAGVPGTVTSEYVEGFVGLYLVTFTVPDDAPSGQRIVLSIGATAPDGQTY